MLHNLLSGEILYSCFRGIVITSYIARYASKAYLQKISRTFMGFINFHLKNLSFVLEEQVEGRWCCSCCYYSILVLLFWRCCFGTIACIYYRAPSQLNFMARIDFCTRLTKSFWKLIISLIYKAAFCTTFYTRFVRVKICRNEVDGRWKTRWRGGGKGCSRRCKQDRESLKANIQTIFSILLTQISRQSPVFF